MEAGIARHKGNGRVPTPGNGLCGVSAADQLSAGTDGRAVRRGGAEGVEGARVEARRAVERNGAETRLCGTYLQQ